MVPETGDIEEAMKFVLEKIRYRKLKNQGFIDFSYETLVGIVLNST